MKEKIIIANWKMSLTLKETEDLTQEILKGLNEKDTQNTDIILCPSFTALKSVGEIIKKSGLSVSLGAQNVFWQEKGAYTGEVSLLMLKELGVKYIIIGHSERRINLKETDEMIRKKIKIALSFGFIPILCVGENFEEKNNNRGNEVVLKQISTALNDLDFKNDHQLIIAYEPVWAISSVRAANLENPEIKPEEIELMNSIIRQRLIEVFGNNLVEKNINIIYGGSVDSDNIKGFLEKNINGFLVGGASLKSQEFIKIIKISS